MAAATEVSAISALPTGAARTRTRLLGVVEEIRGVLWSKKSGVCVCALNRIDGVLSMEGDTNSRVGLRARTKINNCFGGDSRLAWPLAVNERGQHDDRPCVHTVCCNTSTTAATATAIAILVLVGTEYSSIAI